MNNPTTAAARTARREAGTAYIVVLLALVVLTVVGISLSLITQGEMQIGANERTIQRVFYAADTGSAVATARALGNFNYTGLTYTLKDEDTPAGLDIRHRVEVTPFYLILEAPCNLCEINDAGAYSNDQYQKLNHAVTTNATRVIGATDEQMAAKILAQMVGIEPWPADTSAYLPLDDPDALAKIRF